MLRYKRYDEQTLTEEAWFDSTMIIYTRMVENPNGNFGELYITYKGGATYVYHDVSFQDYVVFIGGGTDGSHGKTINKIIKGQYEFEKLEPQNVDELEGKCLQLLEEEKKKQELLQNDFNVKWDQVKERIVAVLDYMEKQKKETPDITEETYNELMDYLDASFGKNFD